MTDIFGALVVIILLLALLGMVGLLVGTIVKDNLVPPLPPGYRVEFVEDRIGQARFDKYVLYGPGDQELGYQYASIGTVKRTAQTLAQKAIEHQRYIAR